MAPTPFTGFQNTRGALFTTPDSGFVTRILVTRTLEAATNH
jgi:hypothetical protein